MIFLYLGIILVAVAIIGFIIIFKYEDKCNNTFAISCCIFHGLGVIITLCWAVDRDINPTAIDVYRNKTTIEITYKDGVAIDTVVVFKSKK